MRPDFLIVGAPKAGTTWLYRNLAANPRIFLTANKEPRYYSVEEGEAVACRGPGDDGWIAEFVRGRGEYEALYAAAAADQVRGEASSDYLYRSAVAARRIREEAPGARIVVLLRDPVDRAYSNWLHLVRDGHESLSFAAALAAEPERIESGWAWWWHYAERGYYSRQLQPFLEHFPPEQLLLLTYDELRGDPRGVLARASTFLGVEAVVDGAVGESRNASLIPRSPLHRAARRLLRPSRAARVVLPRRLRDGIRRRLNRATLHRPQIAPEDYRRLQRRYAADLGRLRAETGLDVSGWTA